MATGDQYYYLTGDYIQTPYPTTTSTDWSTTWYHDGGGFGMNSVKQLVDKLENEAFRVCPWCEGEGDIYTLVEEDLYKLEKCCKCGGEGHVLTSEGKKLKDLLGRLSRMEILDETDE